MDNCQLHGYTIGYKTKLDVDLSGEPVDQSDYRSKIGSLMYLTSSRPDLVQAPYSERCHAGCLDTRKSTSGGIQFLGDKLVSCLSRKKTCTAVSSASAGVRALLQVVFIVMWMRIQSQIMASTTTKNRCIAPLSSLAQSHATSVQHTGQSTSHPRYHFIKGTG
ncbi:hypothetical protein Tco_1204177 [Tanacetum coccineum]